MKDLLKEHVLMYLADNRIENFEELKKLVRSNIRFEDASDRVIKERLKELEKRDLAGKFEVKKENREVYDLLGFIYWSKYRDTDWEVLIQQNSIKVYRELVEKNGLELGDLVEETGLSRPTVSKYLNILEDEGFIETVRQKPRELKPLLNDESLFYINLYGFDLSSFSQEFGRINEDFGRELKSEIAKIHTYSTTVTEGNTATEEEVEKVLGNFPTDLTPKEILEIENSNRAVERLFEIQEEKIKVEEMKNLNRIITQNLLEKPGKIHSGRKRIAGSSFDPPERKNVILNSLEALENMAGKYSDLDAEVLGSIIHFLFVSIHPFKDGNGRNGRLLHSWILLKEDKPLFIYDPDLQNQYFQKLQKGNRKDLRPFIEFCIEEHSRELSRIKQG